MCFEVNFNTSKRSGFIGQCLVISQAELIRFSKRGSRIQARLLLSYDFHLRLAVGVVSARQDLWILTIVLFLL